MPLPKIEAQKMRQLKDPCLTSQQCREQLDVMNYAIEGVTQSCVADREQCYYVHSTRIDHSLERKNSSVEIKMSPSSAIDKVNAAIHNHLAAGEPTTAREPGGPAHGPAHGPGGNPTTTTSMMVDDTVYHPPPETRMVANPVDNSHPPEMHREVPQNPNIPGVTHDTRMGLMNTAGMMGIPGVMLPGVSGSQDSTNSLSKNAPMIILVVLVGLLVWYLMNRNNQTRAASKEPAAPTVASLSAPVYYQPHPQTYYAPPPPSYAPQPHMWYPPPYQQAYPQPSAYPPMIARG